MPFIDHATAGSGTLGLYDYVIRAFSFSSSTSYSAYGVDVQGMSFSHRLSCNKTQLLSLSSLLLVTRVLSTLALCIDQFALPKPSVKIGS